jgi:hypothetical protein
MVCLKCICGGRLLYIGVRPRVLLGYYYWEWFDRRKEGWLVIEGNVGTADFAR